MADADASPPRSRSPRTSSTSRRTARRSGSTPPRRAPSPAADLSRAPLHVAATAGAYTYGTGFPGDHLERNYLVDVVFQKPAPTIAITTPGPAPRAPSTSPRGATIKVVVLQPDQARATRMSGHQRRVAGRGHRRAQRRRDPADLHARPAPLPAAATSPSTLTGVTVRRTAPRCRPVLVVPTTAAADTATHRVAVRRRRAADRRGRRRRRRRSSSARRSRPPRTARSPRSASTRAPGNGGTHTGLALERRRASGWRRSPSPARRRRVGRPPTLATPVAGDGRHDLRRVLLRTAGALRLHAAASSAAPGPRAT